MSGDSVLLGELAEEFTARVRAGQLPEVEDYARRHPDLAARIRELFPALLFLEGMAGGTPKAQDQPSGGELVSGSTFGAYRIEREVGRGGMGVVYEAVHLALNKRVALKVLPVSGPGAAGQLERFLREARTAAGLHHTNIVPVFDVGQVGGVPYYAMQFIDGKGLDRVLGEGLADPTVPYTPGSAAPLPASSPHPAVTPRPDYFRWVARLGIQAAEGLAHAHQRGVVHRDVKPSNLLLDAQGVLWITDFGLARRLEDPALTHSGVLLGTPRYMSPEQAEAASKPLDHRTDIYSLGATLYELVTRRPAFDGRTPQEVVSQIVGRDPVAPRRLNSAIPRDLETIVLKAMAKRPQDRYASAQELADDLGRWLRTEPIRARRIGLIGRTARWCRRNPRLAAVTGSAAAIILLLSSLYYASLLGALGREKEARSQAEASAGEARRRLARHHVDNGVRVMDDGDLLGSLPWFAEALRLEQDDPRRAEMHRRRLAAVLERCPRLTQLWFHEGRVRHVAFSPDGKVVVTAGDDHWTHLWDATTGHELTPPLAHEAAVYHAAFSPDGRRVVTAAHNPNGWPGRWGHELRLWDAATGRPLGPPLKHDGDPEQAIFSPDGRLLLTIDLGEAIDTLPKADASAMQQLVRVWDATSGQPVATLQKNLPNRRVDLAFNADGRRVLVACEEEAQVFDARTGRAIFPPLKEEGLLQASFSGDGGRLLTVGPEVLHVWSAATGQPAGPPVGVRDGGGVNISARILGAQLSPDGRRVLLTWEFPGGNRACVRDVSTGQPAGLVLELAPTSPPLAFAADGRRVTAVDGRGRRVCDPETGACLVGASRPAPAWTGPLRWVSPDGVRVLLPGPQGTAQVWNTLTATPAGPPLKHGSEVTAAAFSPDAARLVTGAADGKVRLWDLAGERNALPVFLGDTVSPWSFFPDGRHVVLCGKAGTEVRDLAEGRVVVRPHPIPRLTYGQAHLTFSPDSRSVLVTNHQGGAWLGNLAAGAWRCLQKEVWGDEYPDAWFSADGRWVGILNSQAEFWDTSTGQPMDPPRPKDERASTAWISPDGTRVLRLILSPDGGKAVVRLDDRTTGRPVGPAHDYPPTALPGLWGSPDGSRLFLLCDDDPGARSLDLATGQFRPLPGVPGKGTRLVAVSPDGKRVLLAGAGGVRVWDADTCSTASEPLAHYQGLGTFSPDGLLVAGVCEDGTAARVWDVVSGRPVTPPLPHREGISAIRFHPNGRLILTFSGSHARVWDTATGEPVTPALECADAVFSPDGRRILTSRDRWTPTCAVAPDDRPVTELLRLAEVLAARRIDEMGGYVPLDTDTFRQTWEALRAEGRPEDFAMLAEQKAVWHWKAAGDCAAARDWRAALGHLDRLPVPDPSPWQQHARRGDAWAGLGKRQEAVAEFGKAIEGGTEDGNVWFHRGEAYAELSQWDGAAADFATAAKKGASPTECEYRQALALLAAGRPGEYRALCLRTLGTEEKHAEGSNPLRPWLYVLAPDAVLDLTAPVRLAEETLNLQAHSVLGTLGARTALEAALYRAGRHEDPRLGQSEVRPSGLFFRAMRAFRLGKAGDARQALEAARQRAAEVVERLSTPWTERVELRLLRDEAEKLIGPPQK